MSESPFFYPEIRSRCGRVLLTLSKARLHYGVETMTFASAHRAETLWQLIKTLWQARSRSDIPFVTSCDTGSYLSHYPPPLSSRPHNVQTLQPNPGYSITQGPSDP